MTNVHKNVHKIFYIDLLIQIVSLIKTTNNNEDLALHLKPV